MAPSLKMGCHPNDVRRLARSTRALAFYVDEPSALQNTSSAAGTQVISIGRVPSGSPSTSSQTRPGAVYGFREISYLLAKQECEQSQRQQRDQYPGDRDRIPIKQPTEKNGNRNR